MHLLNAILAYAEAPLDEQQQNPFSLKVKWEEGEDKNSLLLQVETTLGDLVQLLQLKVGNDSQVSSVSTLDKNQIRHLFDVMKEDDWKILEAYQSKQGKADLSFTLKLWSKNKNENLRQIQKLWNEGNPKEAFDLIGSEQPEGINWGEICQSMLSSQRQLVSNLFVSDLGIRLDLEQIHVPLGVVEYFEKPQGLDDSSPKPGSRVYQKKKPATIDYNGFFQKVLTQGHSPKSQGKRLSLIGEPGTGKTVQLLKIADWVLANNLGLPIWVSLAAVGRKPLHQYLVEDWLREAASRLDAAPPEWVRELNQLLQSGRAWLLLDGADEMAVTDPLATLARQLGAPLWKNVPVVLTCRVNVWDELGNPLSEFDTYKLLDLGDGDSDSDQPLQQKLFIDKFFAASHKESSERLWAVLNETGNKRIKDLVLNPLRLLLLCVTWLSGSSQLPNTKVQLYDNFVYALYRLKQQEEFYTKQDQRLKLKAALGHLALRALDAGEGSLLPYHLVDFELLKPHPELFEKALQLGFLNRASTDPTNRLQSPFAFWHPTLGEYFAACAIDDWHFFCERTPNSPDGKQPRWRILEPQWREVFLLWLGREDVSQLKEPLLQHLCSPESWVELDDSNKFDAFQALFLTVAGMAEFKDFSRAEEVLDLCIDLSNPRCFFDRQQGWIVGPNPVGHFAREALLQTDRDLASRRISQKLRQLEKPELLNCEFMLLMLSQIGVGNLEASDTLTELLLKIKNEELTLLTAITLATVNLGNPSAIKCWIYLLPYSRQEELALLTAITLGEINPGNDWAIRISINPFEYIGKPVLGVATAIESLGHIAFNNSLALFPLIEGLEGIEDEELTLVIALSVEKISLSNQKAIEFLIMVLENSPNRAVLFEALDRLGHSTLANKKAISTLSERLKTTEDRGLARLIAMTLARIDRDNAMTWIDYLSNSQR